MKKQTMIIHTKIANDIMFYIYKYIDTDINIDELSINLKISRFHMQRIFKKEFGKNIYETIKSIRLQKASLLLLTNKNSTITEIGKVCGYSSQGAFIRVFKQKFDLTPKQWRKGEYKNFTNKMLKKTKNIHDSNIDFSYLEPMIVKMPSFNVYYIRHKGYDKSIKKTWQELQTWILSNNIKNYKQIAIHHDNPLLTNLNECKYNACLFVKDKIENISLPNLITQAGVYAKFNFEGKYGDILHFLNWVYFKWLINSGYETNTLPSFAIYEKNHFLENGNFIVNYYIPIKF